MAVGIKIVAEGDAEAVVTQAGERRWALRLGFVLSLLTSLPYLIGFAVEGQNWRYGGLLIAAEDGNSYLAKMALGAAGDWLFRTPYTPSPQQGFLAFLPYILLGKLAAPPGLFEQLVVWFHIFRVSGVVFLSLVTYQFASLFIKKVSMRRLAVLLSLLGGGLGFFATFGLGGLWQGVMKMPMEFYSPETFGFLSVLAFPHLAWARAFLLLGFIFYLRGDQEPAWRNVLKVGLAWWGVGLMQPLTVVSAYFVMGVYLLVWAAWLALRRNAGCAEWRQAIWRAFLAGVISSPLVIYNFLSFQLDPFLKLWQTQNLIPSPPIGDYLLSFGVLIPFIVWGFVQWKQISWRPYTFLLAWGIAFPFLAYAPYNLQRRLPEGIWVGLSVLAVTALDIVPQKWRKIAYAWLSLAFVSSLLLYAGGMMQVSHPQPPLFRPLGEVNAMRYLAEKVKKGDVVLAAYDTSNVLPTRAPVKVLIGHGPESLGLAEIQPRVEGFYQSQTSDAARAALLKQYGIRFVFYGPLEKNLGGWDPNGSRDLRLIYAQGGYELFAVNIPQ
jgi:hypothetical protein